MRIRKRMIVYIAAGITLAIGVVVALGAGWLLKTQSGRDFVGAQVAQLVRRGLHGGHLYVGHLSGSLLGSPSVDSIEVRDADDSVLIATGTISAQFDLVDLWDARVALQHVVVRHPYVHLRRNAANEWNYQKLFASTGPPAIRRVGRHLGDLIRLDSVTISDGVFRWTDPWTPDSSLHGTTRDTSVAHAVTRTDVDIKRVKGGYVRTRTWSAIQANIPAATLRTPGVDGVAFDINHLEADEFDPPLLLRALQGKLVISRDTVHLDFDTFRLAGSGGTAHGTLATKDGLAIALHIVADTVSLSDVAWLFPTFPKDGGGHVTLDIRKSLKRDYTEWALTRMDVHTVKSRLTGAMTFGVGNPVLAVTDVDLGLAPVDFKLFEQFAGKPLAQPWAGQLRGTVHGPGGPLNRFAIGAMALDFTDANVPGVVNQFHGNGEIDITDPSLLAFHSFALTVDHFDLRTPRAVNKDFAPLVGSVSGSAVLDSVWTDIRFHDGDFHYTVESAPESHLTGLGRVTAGDKDLTYDLTMTADPLSLDALAKSYPKLPVRGAFKGPFTVRGTLADLLVNGDVVSDGGRVRADNLHIDAVPPMYKASGKLQVSAFDPSRVFVDAARWKGDVNAVFDAALTGDSIANLDGDVRVTLTRSSLAGVHGLSGHSRFTLDAGHARTTDTLRVHGDGFDATAWGGLGLIASRRDSLVVTVNLDSLGAIRALLAPPPAGMPADSLQGTVQLTARLTGNLDSLDARVIGGGTGIVFGGSAAEHLKIDADVADVLHRRRGTITLQADSAAAVGVQLSGVRLDALLTGGDSARVTGNATSATGPVIDMGASLVWDTTGVRALLDSLHMTVDADQWRLARPALIVASHAGVTIDTVELRSGAVARLTLAATLPDSAAVHGSVNAKSVPLGDFVRLFQVPIPLGGNADVTVGLSGTRSAPTIDFEVQARDAQFGDARVEGLDTKGKYADRMVSATLDYRRKGAVVMHGDAQLPMDLSLRPVPKRLLDTPLKGSLRADTTDLAIVETFSSALTRASGSLDVHLALAGTWAKPQLTGNVQIEDGAFGFARLGKTRYDRVHAHINFFGDSIAVDTLSAHSGVSGAWARTSGFVKVTTLRDPEFNLTFTASQFQAVDKAGLATPLEITTTQPVHLVGRESGSVVTGGVLVNGKIIVPSTGSKNLFSLDDPDLFLVIDTTVFANRRLLPGVSPAIIQNLRVDNVSVTAGSSLWLKSDETNIKLAGELSVKVGTSQRLADRGQRQLALDGELRADQGSYRLNLGPVQRTFIVEPGGTVRFFGTDPDINPLINITAVYTVHQSDQHDVRQDVRVRVNIGGTLSALTAQLSSPDSLQISRSDLVSYLVTGQPTFDIGGRASDYSNAGQRVLVSSLGSLLGSRFSGGFFDEVSVSTFGSQTGYSSVTNQLLAGTRVGASKQLNDHVNVHVDGGLCSIGQGSLVDPVALANTLAMKADYKFSNGLTFSGGLEPATSALLCAQGGQARGFVPTPRQWGLDLLRIWRF